MPIYGHIYAHIWPYMAIYGYIWPYIYIYVAIYMAIYGHIWPYMLPYMAIYMAILWSLQFINLSLTECCVLDGPPLALPQFVHVRSHTSIWPQSHLNWLATDIHYTPVSHDKKKHDKKMGSGLHHFLTLGVRLSNRGFGFT